MAVPIDRNFETGNLKQGLAVAQKYLPKDERAKLEVSPLPKMPEGVEGANKAFEFDPLGTLLKMYALNEEGRAVEVFVSGPVNRLRRSLVATSLGFNPAEYRKLTVHATTPYLGKREYFVENK